MYERYNVDYVKHVIPKTNVSELSKDANLKRIHSYIVYNDGDNYLVQYNICDKNAFNELRMCDVIDELTKSLSNNNTTSHVVTYKMSSLSTLCKMYKPMIVKMAKEQCARWKDLEFEDAIQMCNLTLCNLYYKGYYIHRNLLHRAYNNYILMFVKKDRNKPNMKSLDDAYSKSDDDQLLTIKDMIPDVADIQAKQDEDNLVIERKIVNEMRDIIIDYIGPRQYDQLLREYTNKQTTNWSRKLMMDLKAHLFELGISYKSFNKYYN